MAGGGGGGAMAGGGGGARTGGGGGSSGGGGGGGGGSGGGGGTVDPQAVITKMQQDLQSASPKLQNINSLWDLVNAQVSTTVQNGQTQRTVTFPSPLQDQSKQSDLLPKLLDTCTTSGDMELPPRINLMTAQQAVLATLKDAAGLTDDDISSITGARPAPGSTNVTDVVWKTPAWLVLQANLSASQMKKLEPLVTARTQVYRMQVVGYFDQGGPMARVEAVVDTNQGRPRILYYRDITELGKGFDVGGAAK